MKENNLIALALNYYDTQTQKYKKYYDNKYNIKFYHEHNFSSFELKEDTKILMKGEYNIIGYFYKNNNTFAWGWDTLATDNNNKLILNTYYIKRIIIYILNIVIEDNEEEIKYYSNLINTFLHHRIIIKYPLQLEILLAITLYITNSDFIYKRINKNNNNIIEYYIFKNSKLVS